MDSLHGIMAKNLARAQRDYLDAINDGEMDKANRILVAIREQEELMHPVASDVTDDQSPD